MIMVITVTRKSSRFVARLEEIPANAIIRMEGVRWGSEHKA